ncbi:MAG: DegV family EDD domain-containing protein, partial [Candidatus Heimdallarchaeota archaeon]|nr:DegV family EDD domain-containing protein [Candidatus Heimdallarchaeota archaeon]MCK4876689.1 DegV family EDD domain-containing protein [Candidatus Heimdallarchaeota archaeon]
MKIKLITDASCLIPRETYEKEDIGIFESIVMYEGKEFKELTELNREEFLNRLLTFDPYPTSTQVLGKDVLEVYNKAIEDGYDEILYLGLAATVSSQMNVARIIVRQVKDKIKITIYPTNLVAGSQGSMVYNSIKMLKQGKSVEEIIAYLDSIKEKIYSIGVAVDMESLFKSGRVKKGSAKGIMASLLKMKPLAEINTKDGVIGVGAGTSFKSAIKKMIDKIKEHTDSNITYDLFIADALNPELM